MISLVKLLQEIRLLEKNKTVDFFRKNPRALKYFSIPDAPGGTEWDLRSFPTSGEPVDTSDVEQAYDAIARLDPSNEFLKSLKTELRSYNREDVLLSIDKSSSYEEFLRKYGDTWYTTLFTAAGEQAWKDSADHDTMNRLWKQIQRITKAFAARREGTKNIEYKRFEKAMYKLGLNPNSVRAALDWVKYYTAGSYRKIDPEAFDALQQITVDASRLPKYIYRGFFFDGAKIKDREKFIQKWKEGSMPKSGLRKATSWSGDKGTAVSFMTDQDRVKNADEGFHVLLKWKVRPESLIADLRNLPADYGFWNQHEFIVHPDVKDYVVDKLIPFERADTSGGIAAYDKLPFTKFSRSVKGGVGGFGQSKGDTLTSFLFNPYDKYGRDEKIAYKQLLSLTTKDAIRKFNVFSNMNNWWKRQYGDLAFPLAAIWRQIQPMGRKDVAIHIDKVISPTEATLKFYVDPSAFYSAKDLDGLVTGLSQHVDQNYGDTFKPRNATDVPVGYGSISLDDGYGLYNMRVTIKLPNTYKIETLDDDELGSSYRDQERVDLSNKIWAEIFKMFGPQKIVRYVDKNIASSWKKSVPKTVKLTIK